MSIRRRGGEGCGNDVYDLMKHSIRGEHSTWDVGGWFLPAACSGSADKGGLTRLIYPPGLCLQGTELTVTLIEAEEA
jgi:hypothetical protein